MSDQEPVDMSELVAGMEDWSLQAIVRGSSGDVIDMDFQTSFSDHDFLASFPDIFEAFTGSSDQQEGQYKPFYPPSLLDRSVLDIQQENVAQDTPPHDHHSSATSSLASVTAVCTPKDKKRKNQHKRVVTQVSAEALSSDTWAWRKYGQKPIKGSPYPRSYYRCSSSKGCLARKQVEQSRTDPGMFIITYTSEHSHSKPTRRNSLAGTVRQKFPSPKSQNSTTVKQEQTQILVSPKTHQQASCAEMDIIPQTRIKEEESEFVFDEDFFSGLQDFDDFISEMPADHDSALKFPVSS